MRGSVLMFAAGCLVLASLREARSAVRLQSEIEVRDEVMRLSDFLPGAEAALRERSHRIELGKSPLPGSMRILQGAQIAARLAVESEILRQIEIPERLTVRRATFPIARERVRMAIEETLRAGGKEAKLQDQDLRWSGGVASEEDPALQVEEMRIDQARQILAVRLRCRQRELCGSFLAAVEVTAAPPAGGRGRVEPRAERETGAGGRPLTRAGQASMLILSGGGVRLTIAVTCLQAGFAGQQVRVMDTTHHRVLMAEVHADGSLVARF